MDINLPLNYNSRKPEHFEVERIILAKESTATKDRQEFIDKIIVLYPDASVEEQLNTPHNRIEFTSDDPLKRLVAGKRTLVFGVHKSAVRFSDEGDNTCPNYWHFSPYSFCPYGCKYCYLAGTRSIYFSPSVKIFVNLPQIIQEIDKQARKVAMPTAFYLGKLQDALALDPLTGYSQVLIPFFAQHPYAHMTLLTKSADVENLLKLNHNGRTVLSWSLNPSEVHNKFEENVPSPNERINAMCKCSEAGYPIRVVIMPMIPIENWRSVYKDFITHLLESVPLQRLTMAGICSYADAKRLMECNLGKDNSISSAMEPMTTRQADHRNRFSTDTRIEMYQHIISIVKDIQPDLPLALCLEEPEVMQAVELSASFGNCNCVL